MFRLNRWSVCLLFKHVHKFDCCKFFHPSLRYVRFFLVGTWENILSLKKKRNCEEMKPSPLLTLTNWKMYEYIGCNSFSIVYKLSPEYRLKPLTQNAMTKEGWNIIYKLDEFVVFVQIFVAFVVIVSVHCLTFDEFISSWFGCQSCVWLKHNIHSLLSYCQVLNIESWTLNFTYSIYDAMKKNEFQNSLRILWILLFPLAIHFFSCLWIKYRRNDNIKNALDFFKWTYRLMYATTSWYVLRKIVHVKHKYVQFLSGCTYLSRFWNNQQVFQTQIKIFFWW